MEFKRRIPAKHCHRGDHFDRLPDSLILVIFDKVADVRSLLRCSKVSKRFSGLVPLVHDVFLKIDWPAAEEDDLVLEAPGQPLPDTTSSMFTVLKLMSSEARKSYRYFPNANVDDENEPLSARKVLRKFTHVRNLKIELPPCSPRGGGGGGPVTRDGKVLKWSAEFGSTLQCCLIMAATGMEEHNQVTCGIDGSIPETFFFDRERGEKERFVTAVELLKCASSRHYHLLPIISDHPSLRSVVFTDADGLGTLRMGPEQLEDCRENPPQVVPAAECRYKTTAFPLLKRKSACASKELGEGRGRQKAAIMVIKPCVEGDATTTEAEEVEELLTSGALEGPFVHVAKKLLLRPSSASQ